MDRRAFIKSSVTSLAYPSLAQHLHAAEKQSPHAAQSGSLPRDAPNILLIMTDQQRFDSLPCYGAQAIKTPNFDRITQQGVVFEDCYVNATICTPSRASLLTGKSVMGHGVDRLYDILPQNEVLFPKRLQQAGYQTALVGKLHVSSLPFEAKHRNKNDGFDLYEWCEEPSVDLDSPFNAYAKWLQQQDPTFYRELKARGRKVTHIPAHLHMTHWATERTMEFIRDADRSKPFFCMMSLFDPHNPYDQYPPEMKKLVDQSKLPEPVFTPEENVDRPYGVREESAHGYMGPFSQYTHEQLMQMRLGYFAEIAFIDQELGRLLNHLEQMQIADNTLIVFTSDHGDMLGDHRLLAKGAFFYDPCSRVPLLIRWPARFNKGIRVPNLVQPHDLAATILDAASCWTHQEKAARPESISLIDLCSGQTAQTHEYAICVYRNSGVNDRHTYFDPPIDATMIRDMRYKMNLYHTPVDSGPEGELYDMVNDPGEVHDLWNVAEYLPVQMRMTTAMTRWMVERQVQYFGSRGGSLR